VNTPVQSPCHVFGPVPSRRLGRSLGVDLVPFKTCSYDCIYRPCTVEDVAQGLLMKPAEVVKLLADLETLGQVRGTWRGAKVFYRPALAGSPHGPPPRRGGWR
jgi:hypothetical protein